MKKIFKKIIVKILTWQARLVLLRYKPKIIAITGSVGKTSTKDAIFTVLSKFKIVRKSDKRNKVERYANTSLQRTKRSPALKNTTIFDRWLQVSIIIIAQY